MAGSRSPGGEGATFYRSKLVVWVVVRAARAFTRSLPRIGTDFPLETQAARRETALFDK